MKKLILPILLMLIWSTFTAAGCKEEMGTLNGKVEFKGVPCQPGQTDFNVPPCSGAYPNLELAIFRRDDPQSPVLKLKSGVDGKFSTPLPAGDYIIYTQNGLKPENRKENVFSIRKQEGTEIKLLVNTGIQ